MYQKIMERCNNGDSHPNTRNDFPNDFKKVIDDGWKHACYSLLHFCGWFRFDWIHLIDYGFGLYEIEIDQCDVVVGKAQVIFNPEKIVSKREMSIEEYNDATYDGVQYLGD